MTPKLRPNAQVKLICFAYAGGGVSVYLPWANKLSDNVELNIVQLPGRGTNLLMQPIDNMEELILALLPNVSHLLQGKYVIFGHSLGSRVGFELIRLAMSKGFGAPWHFFASGSASPKAERLEHKIHLLADEAFIEELEKYNGTPKEVLQCAELMELLLPTLRADFKIAEQYCCKQAFKIPAGVTVLFGKEDNISMEKLKPWGDFFAYLELSMCDGGHFFIDTHRQQVLDIVNKKIASANPNIVEAEY